MRLCFLGFPGSQSATDRSPRQRNWATDRLRARATPRAFRATMGRSRQRASPLLPALALDPLVDLLLHSLQVERCRILHRREFDGSPGEFRDLLLHHHEAPELSSVEIIDVTGRRLVET